MHSKHPVKNQEVNEKTEERHGPNMAAHSAIQLLSAEEEL